MKVVNKSRVDFKYRASQESPEVTKTIFSNVVCTSIVKNMLVVEKSVDKAFASIYEELCYSIIITNISNSIVNNIILKDILPAGVKFVNNTLFINQEQYRCQNPMCSINLGSLASQNKIRITFKCVIEARLTSKSIINYSIVSFDYIYNIEKPPIRVSVRSNAAVTVNKDDLFKQLVVNSKAVLNKFDYLIEVKTKAKIIDTKVISYIVNPKMCSLILLGVLTYKVYYIYRRKLYSFKFTEGFSDTILVPRGSEYLKDNIQAYIYNENVNYTIMNKNDIFLAQALFIKIGAKK